MGKPLVEFVQKLARAWYNNLQYATALKERLFGVSLTAYIEPHPK